MAEGKQKVRSLAAVLKEGLVANVVKNQEKCWTNFERSFTKITDKHLSYKGVHSRDLYAETLMPEWKLQQHFSSTPVALKVDGDGNCLYRSCSKLLCGKQDLWPYLRHLTSLELYLNKGFYAKHPYITEKATKFHTYNTTLSLSLSDKILEGYKPKIEESQQKLIENQAIFNAVPGNYAPLMCMLGLSSVIGKEILSVYPENEGHETRYSWNGNGLIKPRVPHTKLDIKQKIVIMWSKSGSLSFLSGVDKDFKPNHFVPLVDIESCHPHTGFSRTAQMSSTKIKVDGKDHQESTKIKIDGKSTQAEVEAIQPLSQPFERNEEKSDRINQIDLDDVESLSKNCKTSEVLSNQIKVDISGVLLRNELDKPSYSQTMVQQTLAFKPQAAKQGPKDASHQTIEHEIFGKTTSSIKSGIKRSAPSFFDDFESKRPKIPLKSENDPEIDKMDIGNYVGIEIDDDTKYRLIENHWKPCDKYLFPSRHYGTKRVVSRRFILTWLRRWQWLSYSKKFDGAFCVPCVLFGQETGAAGMKLVKLYKEPVTNWQNAVCKFEEHCQKSPLHKSSVLRASSFKQVMSGKREAIDSQLDRLLNERINQNRKILHSMVETVVLLGKQNIAFRGHRDDSKNYNDSNPGNFQALLSYRISSGDEVLKKHFETAAKNATYRSKTVQNQLIKICGKQLEQKIAKDVNDSVFFSILADESTDCSKKEQMAIVIRYIDKDDIAERFLRFIHCIDGTSGDVLANEILTTLKDIGLPIQNCRGQGYDGASAMASLKKGVAGNILRVNPNADYVHCASHRLNLCVAKSCGINCVSNALDSARSLASFFNRSTKRAGFLNKKFTEYGLKRSKLADPSLTRWVERIRSLDGLVDGHEAIVEALEEIKLNVGKLWNPPTPAEASQYFSVCTSFEFIVTIRITTGILDYTMPLTRRLQERKIDVLSSLNQIQLLKETISDLRAKVDETHGKLYQQCLQMAEKINVPESRPRVCKVQIFRENYPADSPSEYYKQKITIPLLDHLSNEINERFSTKNCKIISGLYVIPSVFAECSESDVNWKSEVLKFAEIYQEDFPDYHQIATELEMWERFWKTQPRLPTTIAETLKKVDKIAFRNIYICLKILGVVPVTSCECERSMSAMRRLKTWLRSTMNQERFNALALMHINNDLQINNEDIVNDFARNNKTRMAFKNILDDEEK